MSERRAGDSVGEAGGELSHGGGDRRRGLGRRQAEHRLHADRQPRLWRTRRLRRRRSSRRADAAHRRAGDAGHAPAELQRRSAVHALARGADDRPVSDPLRRLRGRRRRHGGRTDAVGSHHRAIAVGARLRHRHVGQVAPRQHRVAAAAQSRLRRVVRHPAHLRRKRMGVFERDQWSVAVGRRQARLERDDHAA